VHFVVQEIIRSEGKHIAEAADQSTSRSVPASYGIDGKDESSVNKEDDYMRFGLQAVPHSHITIPWVKGTPPYRPPFKTARNMNTHPNAQRVDDHEGKYSSL